MLVSIKLRPRRVFDRGSSIHVFNFLLHLTWPAPAFELNASTKYSFALTT